MLADELDNDNLKESSEPVLKTQGADGCADYRRLFREAAVGSSARARSVLCRQDLDGPVGDEAEDRCAAPLSACSRSQAFPPCSSRRSRSPSWSMGLATLILWRPIRLPTFRQSRSASRKLWASTTLSEIVLVRDSLSAAEDAYDA